MLCAICNNRVATQFLVVTEPRPIPRAPLIAKAHACMDCLETLALQTEARVESVSQQDYNETEENWRQV